MSRFLSAGWFDTVEEAATSEAADAQDTGPPDLVLQQVVTGGPDGEVRYRVEVRGARASLSRGTRGEADMTFTSDYETASAIACGVLSTQAALLEGRIRVAGNPVQLVGHKGALKGPDAVPSKVRAETTYS